MSRTAFVDYGGLGFWAYDVGLGIFLKFLIDRAALRTSRLASRGGHGGTDPDQSAWLSSCIDDWRFIAAVRADTGLSFDFPMSQEQMRIILELIDEACRELGAVESVSGQEMEAWDVRDGHGVFSRGHAEFPTAPVIELGRAIQDVLQGALLPAPTGTLWYFGTPTGRQTISVRFQNLERPEGISIKINSALGIERSFLVSGETDVKTGQVNPILKFMTNAALPQAGQMRLTPSQAEAIFALARETKLALFPPDDDSMTPAGDLTTVTVNHGRFRLELEYRSDAPTEWKQVEKLVRMVRELASQAVS